MNHLCHSHKSRLEAGERNSRIRLLFQSAVVPVGVGMLAPKTGTVEWSGCFSMALIDYWRKILAK